MAWGALENVLATAMAQKSREPIEQLRRPEMIPIGRAIYGLGEAVMNWLPKREDIETQLRAIRYLESEGSPLYGRAPWRVLPPDVQKALLKKRPDAQMLQLLNEVFEELPAPLGTSSPSQAA